MSKRGNVGKIVSGLIMIIVRFEILCLLIGLWLGLLSSLADFSNLCFPRYNFDSMTSTSYAVAANVTVRGDGNYTTVSNTVNGRQVLSADTTKYGHWVKANYIVQPNQTLKISVSGNLSLCRAYVPLYNLQDRNIPSGPPNSNIYYSNSAGKKIPIPRVEENAPPLTLIFDARTNGWRNLTEVYRNDLVKVILNDNVKPVGSAITYPNTLTANDCSSVNIQSSPSCDSLTGNEKTNCLAQATTNARAVCNNSLNVNAPAQNISSSNCNSLTGDLRTACLAQAAASPTDPVPSLTLADCNGLPDSQRLACIAAIPVSAATNNPPASGPSMTPQQTAAAEARDNLLNVTLPAANSTRTQIANQLNTTLPADRTAAMNAVRTDYNTALAALDTRKASDIAAVDNNASLTSAQKNTQKQAIEAQYTTDKSTLDANSTARLATVQSSFNTQRTDLTRQLADTDATITQLNQQLAGYNSALSALSSNSNNTIVTDSITNVPTVADCSEGKRIYSPICGRYSLWNGSQQYGYRVTCETWSRCDHQCNCSCKNCVWPWDENSCDQCSCYGTYYTQLPPAYLDNGSLNIARFTSPSFMLQDLTLNPAAGTPTGYCGGNIAAIPTQFWFTATDASGLQYRFDNQVYPTNPRVFGNGKWVSVILPGSDTSVAQQTDSNRDSDRYTARKIYSGEYNNLDSPSVAYLQYRFHGADYSTTQTGGYVFQLRQTKCRRLNGNFLTDSYPDRGAVQYIIAPSGQDPNNPANSSLANNATTITFDSNNSQTINTGEGAGYFWFRINNKPTDYPDSIGSYLISISGQQTGGSFTLQVINPLFKIIRDRIYDISLGTFTNMICYKQEISGSCTNFFNYIRALLMLNVMLIGYRFLLGVDIKQQDLVKNLAKIAIVAGLINGTTFEYFHQHIFPFVTGFSDQMIANMSGFSMISASNSVSNPFMFMDSFMSKVFLSPTFLFQVLTVIGMGLTGVLFFIIICISVIVFLISIFRAMAIYVMALIATAFLIGIAPVFIVFILFEETYYLFENWAKFLFKYMMEPVIVMAGIIILTQLFTMYVDEVLSYSLCWKCVIAFHLPFASLLPFPGLQEIPLFCIYWFGPWGLSPTNDMIGMNAAMMVGMAMVAYSAYGYVELASKMAERLCGSGGGPSSISMGREMSHHMGQTVLKQYGLDDKSISAAKAKLKEGLDSKMLDKVAANRAAGAAAGAGPSGGGAAGGTGAPPAPTLNPTSGANSSNGGGVPPVPSVGGGAMPPLSGAGTSSTSTTRDGAGSGLNPIPLSGGTSPGGGLSSSSAPAGGGTEAGGGSSSSLAPAGGEGASSSGSGSSSTSTSSSPPAGGGTGDSAGSGSPSSGGSAVGASSQAPAGASAADAAHREDLGGQVQSGRESSANADSKSSSNQPADSSKSPGDSGADKKPSSAKDLSAEDSGGSQAGSQDGLKPKDPLQAPERTDANTASPSSGDKSATSKGGDSGKEDFSTRTSDRTKFGGAKGESDA